MTAQFNELRKSTGSGGCTVVWDERGGRADGTFVSLAQTASIQPDGAPKTLRAGSPEAMKRGSHEAMKP